MKTSSRFEAFSLRVEILSIGNPPLELHIEIRTIRSSRCKKLLSLWMSMGVTKEFADNGFVDRLY